MRITEGPGGLSSLGYSGGARHLLFSFFFFSSRRRHTRCLSDWSSDVCSSDLAFTPPEADALLAEHGLSLSADQTERLVERTEGWAAGLRLAALSLQGEDDPETFLAEFTGDDHAVADYLSGEVLAQQTPATRRFL